MKQRGTKKIIKIVKKIFKMNTSLYSLLELYVKLRYSSIIKNNKRFILKHPHLFIKNVYKKHTGKIVNLDNPKSFNEKLQWLKLYWYDERATRCADKYRVREYVKEKGLEIILNDLIGVYDNTSEINLELLPDKFVLKPTHDSSHSLVCKNKKTINWKIEFSLLDFYLKCNYAYVSGEWQYSFIKPRIICEKYLEDHETKELLDYKFFCFNGEPKYCRIIFYENGQHKSNFYDMSWKFIKKWQEYPYSETRVFNKPDNFEEMKNIAKTLSGTFPHVRVDLYSINNKIYFGELTFFTTGGFGYFSPYSFNLEMGDMLKLPDKSDPWGILTLKEQ